MKILYCLLVLCCSSMFSISATAQTKQQVFLQLTNPSGQMVHGSSVQRGYERQIITTSFSGVATESPQVQFSMPSGAASATLATLQGGKNILPYAVFTTTQYGEQGLIVLSTVRLEEVIVIKTEDVNGSSHVTLRASRIGTTYYQYDLKKGIRAASGKTGFDFGSGKSWTAF